MVQSCHISIVLPDLCGGGAERVSVDLAHAFKAAGHEVEFVLMQATGDSGAYLRLLGLDGAGSVG